MAKKFRFVDILEKDERPIELRGWAHQSGGALWLKAKGPDGNFRSIARISQSGELVLEGHRESRACDVLDCLKLDDGGRIRVRGLMTHKQCDKAKELLWHVKNLLGTDPGYNTLEADISTLLSALYAEGEE